MLPLAAPSPAHFPKLVVRREKLQISEINFKLNDVELVVSFYTPLLRNSGERFGPDGSSVKTRKKINI